MSKVGFRREVLGFNREDVIDYIRKMQQGSTQREKELVESIQKLDTRNAELIDELKKIPELEAKLKISEATIEKLALETANLDKKKAEAEQMSEDIAKMYLVAKANADAINKGTKQSSELAFYEIKRTLDSLEQMHNKLSSIKKSISDASDKYTTELNYIFESFDKAKATIEDMHTKIDEVNNSVKA